MRTRAPPPATDPRRAVELLAQPRKRVHVVVDHRLVPFARLSQDCERLTRWSSRPGTSPATPLPGTQLIAQLRTTTGARVRRGRLHLDESGAPRRGIGRGQAAGGRGIGSAGGDPRTGVQGPSWHSGTILAIPYKEGVGVRVPQRPPRTRWSAAPLLALGQRPPPHYLNRRHMAVEGGRWRGGGTTSSSGHGRGSSPIRQ